MFWGRCREGGRGGGQLFSAWRQRAVEPLPRGLGSMTPQRGQVALAAVFAVPVQMHARAHSVQYCSSTSRHSYHRAAQLRSSSPPTNICITGDHGGHEIIVKNVDAL
mgnify:CR=1 FL=1